MQRSTSDDGNDEASFAIPLPKTSGELITILAHYHRAEIARMAGWRDRLDRTTNWAITVIAAMLSVSLSAANAHHGVLLFAMLLTLLLCTIEARRYRFFDVYRNRVRLLERYYYAQLFAPGFDYDKDWTRRLGTDLRRPYFGIRLIDAMGRRLRRNYIWMFLILLLAWSLKISPHEITDGTPTIDLWHAAHDVVRNASIGIMPGIWVMLCVVSFYSALSVVTLRSWSADIRTRNVEVHV